MAIHTVRFEVSFSRRQAGWALAGLLLFAVAPDLTSETLTLSTYYPAPLGVYRELVTTGTGPTYTLLARDNGAVGINTTDPTTVIPTVAQTKLGIRGAVVIDPIGTGNWDGVNVKNNTDGGWSHLPWGGNGWNYLTAPGTVFRGGGTEYAHIANGNAWFRGTATVGFTAGGTTPRTGFNLEVNGGIASSSSRPVYMGDSGCGWHGVSEPCPSGQFATWTPGVFSEGISRQPYAAPTGSACFLIDVGGCQPITTQVVTPTFGFWCCNR